MEPSNLIISLQKRWGRKEEGMKKRILRNILDNILMMDVCKMEYANIVYS